MAPSLEVTIEPRGCFAGTYRMGLVTYDAFIFAELEGRDPASALRRDASPERGALLLDKWRANRLRYISAKLVSFLAGSACDVDLFAMTPEAATRDWVVARKYARLLVAEAEADSFLADIFGQARELCSGPLRPAIIAAAERLQSRRTIRGADLEALWEEVRPDPESLARPQPVVPLPKWGPWAAK